MAAADRFLLDVCLHACSEGCWNTWGSPRLALARTGSHRRQLSGSWESIHVHSPGATCASPSPLPNFERRPARAALACVADSVLDQRTGLLLSPGTHGRGPKVPDVCDTTRPR